MLENFRLKVFRAVAEHLSFRKAGEALYLTQPAVTLQIKTLEEELNAKLFERSATGVRLTTAGKVLLPYAEELHRIAEQAHSQLAGLKGGVAGELVLGASTTIAQYVLPALISDFVRTFPEVRLRALSQNTEEVCEGVATARFDLGLIEGPALRQDLKIEPWFDDEIVLLVAESHEWAQLGAIEPARLQEVPLVMRERGSGSRHVVEQALQKAGVRLGSLHIAMELDSTEAILSCVEQGLGVGFASEWAIARHHLAVLRLATAPILRNFSFVTPRSPDRSNAALTMLRFLQNHRPISKANHASE